MSETEVSHPHDVSEEIVLPAGRPPMLFVGVGGRRQSLVTPIRCVEEEEPAQQQHSDDELSRFAGFGIEPGTVELVELRRWRLASKPKLPLPTSTTSQSPILSEFDRSWRALRFAAQGKEGQEEGIPLGTL